VPAVIVVAVVLYVAIKDRRRTGNDERSDAEERRSIPAGNDAERTTTGDDKRG
jgi:hypothetical protein